MDQFLGMKMKGVCAVLLFVSLFSVPAVCSAVNACIAGTPILNVIAPNPKAPGATVSYSVNATGSGFATFELRASDVGILKSGTFSSGQTVSGSYKTPSGNGIITFNIKDAGGNVIPNCYAEADLTFAQDECEADLKDEECYYNDPDDYHYWAESAVYHYTPQVWGTPASYFFCFRCTPSGSTKYQVKSSTGIVNSGNVLNNQMVIGAYSVPNNTTKESYSFATPGGWYAGHFLSWATSAPPCDATFQVTGSLVPGANLQFDGNPANINGNRPYNYIWKVDGKDYMQGNDKNIVFDSFPVGNHPVSLTVDDGLGTSCSSNKSVKIITPPVVSSCTADFTAPASAYYDEEISFNPGSSSNTGESGVVYTWYKSDNTFLGTTNFVTPFKHAFDNSNTSPVGVKLHVVHNLTGAVCDSPVHTINLSESPGGNCLPTGTTDENEDIYSRSVSSTKVQTHRLIWEPGKVTYDSFEEEGTGGNNYFHTVTTKDIPVPNLVSGNQEWVMFNIFPYSASVAASGDINDATADDKNVDPAEVILRDFSFVPVAGSTAMPSPSREALDGMYSNPSETVVWKGYTWGLRDGNKGDPGFGGWSKNNVTGPDGKDYLTLKLKNPGNNPVGAEIALLKAGMGYGTYTTVVEGKMDKFDKNVNFEGMSLFFPDWNNRASSDACVELRANETTAWGGGSPLGVQLVHHNSWYGCSGPSGNCPPIVPPASCAVDFEAKNSSGLSCLTGGCEYNDLISFTAFANSGSIISYDWIITDTAGVSEAFDGDINTGASVLKTLSLAEGKSHKVHLLAHDSNGNTCTMDKTINVQPGMPGWNEIAPYLMQLLGPIGFLGVVFLSRAIFLWL